MKISDTPFFKATLPYFTNPSLIMGASEPLLFLTKFRKLNPHPLPPI